VVGCGTGPEPAHPHETTWYMEFARLWLWSGGRVVIWRGCAMRASSSYQISHFAFASLPGGCVGLQVNRLRRVVRRQTSIASAHREHTRARVIDMPFMRGCTVARLCLRPGLELVNKNASIPNQNPNSGREAVRWSYCFVNHQNRKRESLHQRRSSVFTSRSVAAKRARRGAWKLRSSVKAACRTRFGISP